MEYIHCLTPSKATHHSQQGKQQGSRVALTQTGQSIIEFSIAVTVIISITLIIFSILFNIEKNQLEFLKSSKKKWDFLEKKY